MFTNQRLIRGILLIDLAILIAAVGFWPREGMYGCDAGDDLGCFWASLANKEQIGYLVAAVAVGSFGAYTLGRRDPPE